MPTTDDTEFRHIEELVRRVERIADPDARGAASELMSSILALHATGIEKMMDLVAESGQTGTTLLRRFANDPLIASLLVLHGLHPDDLETRIRQVLSKQLVKAEIVGVFEGVVRIRVAPGGCHSSDDTVSSLEAFLREAIPDAVEITVEEGGAQNGFVPLSVLDPFAAATLVSKG